MCWRTQPKIFSSISSLRWHTGYIFSGFSSRFMDISVRDLCSWITGITDKNVIWQHLFILVVHVDDLFFPFPNRLHSVLLLLESALFGLFVIAIMVDQMHAILYDETAIEALQLKGYRPYRPKLMLLKDVCGAHPALWLIPCSSINNKKYDTPLLSHDV